MICPKCKELNQKSTINKGLSSVNAIYYQSYYDEDGNSHDHHPQLTMKMSCSMGHDISIHVNNRCNYCDFGNEETVVVTDTEVKTVLGTNIILSNN